MARHVLAHSDDAATTETDAAYDDPDTPAASAETSAGTPAEAPAEAPADVYDEPAATREDLEREQHALARRDFGGVNWGACCAGFLVALGLTVLLGGVAAGIAAATGVDVDWHHIDSSITTGAAATLAVVTLVGFFAGGYVAGRMTRFDGGRQGIGVWLIAVVLAVIGVAAGYGLGHPQRDVFDRIELPRFDLTSDQANLVAVGAGIVLVLLLLLAAVLGGRTGQRYHRRVDALVGYR